MRIERSFQVGDLNWAALPDLETRFSQLGVEIREVEVALTRYPDTVTYNSLADAARAARETQPLHYNIAVYGRRDEKAFSYRVSRSRSIRNSQFLVCSAGPLIAESELANLTEFLGLVPDTTTPPRRLERTAFVAHRFDEVGESCAEKLARFLELLGFRVTTGRGYAPRSISEKVRSRIEKQAIVFVILTPGPDDTWMVQESALAEFQSKPLFLLREKASSFTPGIFADLEFIPFDVSHIESAFVPILEGLREIGYSLSE